MRCAAGHGSFFFLVGTGWSIDVDPVFQYSGRHCVGFVRDLAEAGSVEGVC